MTVPPRVAMRSAVGKNHQHIVADAVAQRVEGGYNPRTVETTPYFRKCLQDELVRRCEKNARYSLRAFAKASAVDAGTLSRVLSDKLSPSPKLARKLLGSLDLSPGERNRFLESIEEDHHFRRVERIRPRYEKMKVLESQTPRELSADVFRVIAEWYHYAILELTFVRGFKADSRWIASELGITPAEAKSAVDRLLELGLLEKVGKSIRKTDASLTTSGKHLTTPALRRRQKQVLEKAAFSLENDPIEERNHTSMTIAADPERIREAKKMILEFNRKLCRFLEEGTRSRVYELSVALFPIQKRSDRK